MTRYEAYIEKNWETLGLAHLLVSRTREDDSASRPTRDFRKARKVLSGIDASTCPRDFTYGRDGRPCYVRGSDDSEARVDRICSVLEARCGLAGFDFEGPEAADEDDGLVVRKSLREWLEAAPPRRLNDSVRALARALRAPVAPPI